VIILRDLPSAAYNL